MNYKQDDSKRSKFKRIFKKNKAKVDGIREGQELDALLGHQIERSLHDTKKRKKKRKY